MVNGSVSPVIGEATGSSLSKKWWHQYSDTGPSQGFCGEIHGGAVAANARLLKPCLMTLFETYLKDKLINKRLVLHLFFFFVQPIQLYDKKCFKKLKEKKTYLPNKLLLNKWNKHACIYVFYFIFLTKYRHEVNCLC